MLRPAREQNPVILSVGGLDPLCGAGVLLDVQVFRVFGASPAVVVTADVEQDSHGVYDFGMTEVARFERSLARTLHDAPPRAIRVGMLGASSHVRALLRQLVSWPGRVPVVLDPVLAGGGPQGGSLGRAHMAEELVALARGLSQAGFPVLLTPNTSEAAALGRALGVGNATSEAVGDAQGRALLLGLGGTSVLLKGGHNAQQEGDWLLQPDLPSEHFPTQVRWEGDPHGTGCLLASAIAAASLEHFGAVEESSVGATHAGWTQAVRLGRDWMIGRCETSWLQVGRGRAQVWAGPIKEDR